MKKHSIEKMNEIAASKGGRCLSKCYINQLHQYEWECKCGNIWKTSFKNILNGHWCPECGYKKRAKDNTKYMIEDMQKAAAKKGGKCLSKEYINSVTRLEWKCSKGHTWLAIPPSIILAGRWCDTCANEIRAEKRKKHTFGKIKSLIEDKGGIVLSRYDDDHKVGMQETIKILCPNGHTFKKSLASSFL